MRRWASGLTSLRRGQDFFKDNCLRGSFFLTFHPRVAWLGWICGGIRRFATGNVLVVPSICHGGIISWFVHV